MNQTSQYIFNLYHYLLNLRDTLEYTLDRDHEKTLYTQRKEVLTKGLEENTALGNFFKNNQEQGKKITEKLNEFLSEVYGDDSTILTVSGDKVRVDHSQNIKLFDYVVGLSESIRDIIYGYLNYAKSKGEDEALIVDLVNLDDRFYRTLLAMLVMREFEKSFAEFQKVMGETKGQPSPQSNFIVQNEIVKLSNMLRFSREHHHCTDNETLDLLDKVNAVVEMTEGRRDRRNDRSFKDLFDELNKELSAQVGKVENAWKTLFQTVLKEALSVNRANEKVEA